MVKLVYSLLVLIIMAVVLFSIPGCSTTGNKGQEILKEITNLDCLIGFKMGTNLAKAESLEEKVVREEIAKNIVMTSDTYKKCYKAGLVYNYSGGEDITDLLKRLIQANL